MSRPERGTSISTADGWDLVAVVRRFQKRARWVVFLSEMLTTIAVGGAAAMVWNLAWETTARGRWTVLMVTFGGAWVGALALMYLRTPTLEATAAAIDRRLHLQDRIVAALQVGRDGDPVSALVVRDAAARLRAAAPADVFPLDPGRRAVAGTLLVTLALLTVTVDLSRALPSRQPGAGAGAVATTQADDAMPAEGQVIAPQAATASEVRPAETGSARLSADQRAEASSASAVESVPDRAPSPLGGTAGSESPGSTTSKDAAARLRPATSNPQSSANWPPAGGGEGSGAGEQSTGAQSRAPFGAIAAGAGGATPDPGMLGSQSGGVAAGLLGSRDAITHSGSPGNADRLPSAGGVSRSQADTAASRDDIPPARKQYVRDYFLRLRSTGSPR